MVRFLVRCLLRLCFRVRVRGAIAAHEKLLIVSNHQSLLDGILLGAFLPVQPVWVLHSTIARHWFVRLPMRFLPHLIVDSAHPLGMKAVVGLIESGYPVLIFPEGAWSETITDDMMQTSEERWRGLEWYLRKRWGLV